MKITWTCPYPIRVPQGDHLIEVSCRRCFPCQLRREREWVLRQIFEQSNALHSYFVTLTYSDRSRPGMLVYEDVAKFLKRLRKPLPPESVRYFCVGEYGERFGREHWHLNIFTKTRLFRWGRQLIKPWPNGAIFVGTLTRKSMQYAASYVQEGDPQIIQTSRNPGLGVPGIRLIASRIAEQHKKMCVPVTLHIGKSVFPVARSLREHYALAYTAAGGEILPGPTGEKLYVDRPDILRRLMEGRKTLQGDIQIERAANERQLSPF